MNTTIWQLPNGVGTNGVFAEGPQFPYILTYFALCAHAGPHVAACGHKFAAF